jgi:isoleucyl-tRNA synthetase
LERHEALLAEVFIISQVHWFASEEEAKGAKPLALGVKAEVALAKGFRCPRCWVYFEEIEEEGGLCLRCKRAIQGEGAASSEE